jgi:hypothetical protein
MGFGGISSWQLIIIILVIALFAGGSRMNILNRPLVSSILAIVLYVFVGSVIYSGNRGDPATPLILYFSYLIVAVALSFAFLRLDEKQLKANKANFKREGAFDNYGSSVFDFEYHFRAPDWEVTKQVLRALQSELNAAGNIESINNVVITDKDRKLPKRDDREFLKVEVENTLRKGKVTQLLFTSKTGHMFGIKWWFLATGDYDKWRVVTFLLFSPVSIIFWFIPRLLGNHNLAIRLRNIYPAIYERLDLLNAINALNKLTMDTLIKVLEENGVDVSDLKTQQAQVMNIQISGGKATFGSIAQGSMNKVVSKMSAKQ